MRKQPFKDFISGAGNRPERDRSTIKEIREDPIRQHKAPTFSLGRSTKRNFFSVTSTKAIVFVSIFLFGLFLWFSSAYSSVLVKVTTISEEIVLDDTFVAISTEGAVKDGVVFKRMKIEETASLPITANESRTVSQKASGEIIVYNNFSQEPQNLISGTRFESPDGKIYKIDKAVTVPGRKTISGKIVPGSITVTVYAAEPGKEFNIGPTDFTLPGLKDSPRFKSVYGRGKGDMSGGFSGEMKMVSPSDVAITKKKLEDDLREKLKAKIPIQIPAGYITYNDITFISFEDNSKDIGSEWDGDKVYLKMKGTSVSLIFEKKELASIIAKKKLPTLTNYNVHANDMESLVLRVAAAENLSTEDSKMFSFKLSGATKIVWDIDVENFKRDLLGIKKESYQDIFKKYPTIDRAETVFKPSWSRSFPDDVARINVELIED
jgi:hypothetical protein